MSGSRLGLTYVAALVVLVCFVAMLVGGRDQAGDAPASATRVLAG